MLLLGDGDGVTLELAGEAAQFGGVEGVAKLPAEFAAFFSVGDDYGIGVVVDELEGFSAPFEIEAKQVGGLA